MKPSENVVADRRLGTQIWLERDSSTADVQELVARAAEVGFGQARIFLIWPWIQPHSADHWDFSLFDGVFDAAAAHGMKIKATLTANSGPWWLGTGSVLHSQTVTLEASSRGPMEAYISACVDRYAKHPALGQWILWNEPMNPPVNPWGDTFVTDEVRALWPQVLRDQYGNDISVLNRRWRSGYSSFEDVPMAGDVMHPAHRNNTWRSFGPILSDYVLRSRTIENELAWVAARVREHDRQTELAANPCQSLFNHAEAGYDLDRIGGIVDVVGATFHAPWSFGFAPRDTHTGLVVAGFTLLQSIPGTHATEVTEVQTGNTHYAGHTPLGVSPAQIAATHLAPVLAGAQSVTGWCFNTRSQDFEAGEWGLLDDDNQVGERAVAVTRVARCLNRLDQLVGPWTSGKPSTVVLTSERSQAVEYAFSQVGDASFNRGADVAPQAAALLTVALLRDGVQAALAPISALDRGSGADVIIAPHVAAWSDESGERLLALAKAGATVVVDALTGEFDLDAKLHRPWPGGMAGKIGARSRGLETAHDGTAKYEARLFGQSVGYLAGVRDDFEITDSNWTPLPDLTFAPDGKPVAWEREWGNGRLILVAASIANSILDPDPATAAINYLLRQTTRRIPRPCRPLSASTTVLTIDSDHGQLWGVFAPETGDRQGSAVQLQLAPGRYLDVWTGLEHCVGPDGMLTLPAPEGIALVARSPES